MTRNDMSQSKFFTVLALYRFFPIEDPSGLRVSLHNLCDEYGIKGTLIVAYEGINGTVAGSESSISALLNFLNVIPGFEGAEIKFSTALDMPFYRMKVRLKKEIVTMGVPRLDPRYEAGSYLSCSEWNELVSDPSSFVVDTRNDYEVCLGTFRNSVNPEIKNFSEFPSWVQKNHESFEKHKKVGMFCTGGIRCEKATAYLKSLGVEEVFHLRGGILKYLEEVPKKESFWEGECFVFDQRVSIGYGLAQGNAALCRACRHPLTPEDRESEFFISGISCPYCINSRSQADRNRYAEREKQIALSKKRGASHIGSSY